MLEGKNVIVTGAADGIGAACARRMLERGAAYVAIADINSEKGEALAGELRAEGYETDFYSLDVREESQWQDVLKTVVAKRNGIDVLVNNAGLCELKRIEDMSLEDFRAMNDVNAKGVFLGTRCTVLTMRECAAEGEPAKGSIVNIASIAGQLGMRGGMAYCAGKAAVTNMTKALAVEFGEKREFIRVNSVHPGTVKTAMTDKIIGDEYFADKSNFANVPLNDHANPDDIANAVVYLASDQARMVTGSELTVDGGLTGGLMGEF